MNEIHRVTRRRALGLLAGATAAGAVAACGGSSAPPVTGQSPPPRRTPTAAPHSSPAHTSRPANASDFRALKRSLDGTMVRPGSSRYDAARLLFDRRFDGVNPTAVAQVQSASDIAACVSFAQRFDLPLALRSGGHSYIGASTGPGLVVDLRAMSGVTVNAAKGTATIGAGAALVDVYNELAGHGVSIPAGSCPSVGLSGLALGGGIGVVGRRYGLTCDRLVAATVVSADGTTLTCSPTSHSDLYWALRGGGGSFGVVTSMTFTTHPADPPAHAFVVWPWSAAAEVLTAWQQWAPATPRSLWSACHVLATSGTGDATISVAAVMVESSSASLQQHIGALVQMVPAAPTTNFVDSAPYEYTMMLESGCATLSVMQCHVADETPGGTLLRDGFVAGSDFFREPIPAAGVNALVAAVAARQSDPRLSAGGASFDILGGAVDDLAADATAWVHRGALFDAQYTASWGTSSTGGQLGRNQHSLASIHHSVRRYATGEAYQNYADDSLPNPQQAYYASNLPKLIDVRRTYDPNGVFTQPQGVPLS